MDWGGWLLQVPTALATEEGEAGRPQPKACRGRSVSSRLSLNNLVSLRLRIRSQKSACLGCMKQALGSVPGATKQEEESLLVLRSPSSHAPVISSSGLYSLGGALCSIQGVLDEPSRGCIRKVLSERRLPGFQNANVVPVVILY